MNELSVDNSVLNGLSIAKPTESKGGQELGQTAFLELMIAQLNNQDPLSPQENGEFIAQLAQFSSVEGIERMNKNFESFSDSFMSNQALQASSLVGRSVSVPGDTGQLRQDGVVAISAELPYTTGDLSVNIYDDRGSLVEQIPLGRQAAGEVVMRWDGYRAEVNGEMMDWTSDHGEPLPPGEYRFQVMASQNGEPTQLATSVGANVNSVTIGADKQLTLNLAGIGAVSINDVKQFN